MSKCRVHQFTHQDIDGKREVFCWRCRLQELEAENNAYEKRENAYIAQIDAWEKVTVELLKKGERMAMALSDAQCGYVCEHRMNWSDARKAGNALLEKNDPEEIK